MNTYNNEYKNNAQETSNVSRRKKCSSHNLWQHPLFGCKFHTNMRTHAPFIVTQFQRRSDLEQCVISLQSPMIVCKIHAFRTNVQYEPGKDSRNRTVANINDKEEQARLDYLNNRYKAFEILDAASHADMTVKEYIESQGITYDEEYDEARPLIKVDGMNVYLELLGCLEDVPLDSLNWQAIYITMRRMAAWGPSIFDRQMRIQRGSKKTDQQPIEEWHEDYDPQSYPVIYPQCGVGYTYTDASRRPNHVYSLGKESVQRALALKAAQAAADAPTFLNEE